MKRLLLAIAATLAVASAATAADMPVKARTYTPPEVIANDWRGFYVGVGAGWNLGSFSPVFGSGKTATEVNLDDNSPVFGGHIGFLAQTGSFVIGPEFGVQYWASKAQADMTVTGIGPVTFQQKIDWLAYANVRAGFTPFTSTLIYVTGGAAWAHVKGDLVNLASLNTSFEQSVMGWNIGTGIEFKITDHLTFGAEFRHYDFGNVQAANPVLTIIGLAPDKLTTDQAMARLSYRIN